MDLAGSSPPFRQAFDAQADRYDRWYDSAEGAAVLREELACLRAVCPQCCGRWLEVGVGTGRFASAMGIHEGIDPSPKMLEYAARRGVRTHAGSAEHLAFPDVVFDGVLMALTLCFVQDARQALRECARILRPSGALLVGLIPADGLWGRLYARKAAQGHPVYSLATFRSVSETAALADSAGFVLQDSAGALFWTPGEGFVGDMRIERQSNENAGFVALRFEKRKAEDSCAEARDDGEPA